MLQLVFACGDKTYVDGDEASIGIKIAPWILDDVDAVNVDFTRVGGQVHAGKAASDGVVDLHSNNISGLSTSDLIEG